MQYNEIQYNIIQYNIMQYNIINMICKSNFAVIHLKNYFNMNFTYAEFEIYEFCKEEV